MCNIARLLAHVRRGVNSTAATANCNQLPGDEPFNDRDRTIPPQCWGCFGHGNRDLGCQERDKIAVAQNLDWIFVERWVAAHCFGTFRYVTMLRHPISRIRASYCVHASSREDDLMQWLQSTEEDSEGRWPLHSRLPETLGGLGSVSNFYVRSILGPTSFRQRVLRESALWHANATLHQYAAVLILERMETSLPMLAGVGLDWPAARAVPSTNHIKYHCANWSGQAVLALEQANQLDLALYAYWSGKVGPPPPSQPPTSGYSDSYSYS